VKYYYTDAEVRMEERNVDFEDEGKKEFSQVKVYPEEEYQEMLGFGGAFTESAAYVYSKMGKESKQKLIDLYFGENGNQYNLCRTHIQSCDFSLDNYEYVSDKEDKNLNSFSISRDEKYLIPLIKSAQLKNPKLSLLASPWSPPTFMKSNHNRNLGGKLLEEYRSSWAKLIAMYLTEYRRHGIFIDRITVQNEPAVAQTWDSCVYSAEEESIFAAKFLKPELIKQGLDDVKILIWDHNKDQIVERIRESFSVEHVVDDISGISFHWYTGDHFEALRWVHETYPDKELIFTEGCVEYSRFADKGQTENAEMYAHDIIGNIHSGMNGYIDWNIYLNKEGGPNHVGNFCDAPIMCNIEEDSIDIKLSYYYIGHFSRFVNKNAKKILTSSFTSDLECCGFKNPDGSVVVVVMNNSDKDITYNLSIKSKNACVEQEKHSIITFIYDFVYNFSYCK